MTTVWLFRRAPWLLTALVLAVLLPGTARLPLIDRDEPRFATATREMMDRGDWIVPTFNGHERFDKPVLTYWLMRFGYAVFGVGELGARLHAIAATLALVLVTWWIGRRWFGEGVGLVAGAILASCLQVFIHGRLALADMPMVTCVLVACAALKELLSSTPSPPLRRPAWWLLYGALGLGFLAKGPIVLAVPGLGLLIFRFVLFRKPLPWAQLGIVSGLALSLVMVAAWGIPALIVTDGRFWHVGMGEHVVQRGFQRFNGRGYSPFFYIATAPLSLFPWIGLVGFLPWIVRQTWDDRTAWLVSWIAATYLIFTAYATQLPHYVLPAFPPIAWLLARALAMDRASWPRGAVRFGWVFAAVVGLGSTLALAAVQWAVLPPEVEVLRGAFTGVFGVLLGLILGLVAALLRRLWLVLPALGLIVPGAAMMGGALQHSSLTVNAAEWVSALPKDALCLGAGFSEPSLVFYSGRRWSFPQTAEELATELIPPGPLVVVSVVEESDPLNFFRDGLRSRFGSVAPPRLHPGPAEFAGVLAALGTDSGWRSHDVVGFNLGRTRWQRVRISVRDSAIVAH